ncbi:MAG: hypothetical protein Q8S75_16385, partial [Nitrospirota bacterium]|nr:hypothetical protein [Nitrospirota bacterium]
MATMIRRLALSREQARKVSAGGTLVDRVLKRLADERIVRPSQVYRLLVDLPDEALVLALATQMSLQQAAILSRLKGQLVAYMKNRTIKTTLMGRDLQSMGLMPGPQYGTILGKLLEARIDGTITTESDERALAYKLLKNGFSSFVKHETV